MIKIPAKKLFDGNDIPALGIGTWTVGGRFFHEITNDDEKDIDIIKTAIKEGITHIDTAEMYSAGHAEILVGKAIKEFDRKKLFITTKLWPLHAKYNEVKYAAKRSMERMQIDYIDLYLIHVPNYDVPLKETMRAMNELVDEGIVRYIGVSNFSLELMKEAQSYSKHKIVTNQVLYNLLDREADENGLLKYCQENDIILTAYQPVKRGELTVKGKYPILDQMAEKYGKTPAQIAINWLISKKNVITIPKTSKKEHLYENLGSVGWSLTEEDIEILDKTFFEYYKKGNIQT